MVMSGNSSFSKDSTSPIDRYVRSAKPTPLPFRRSRQIDELELTDLDLVPACELGLFDALPVQVRAVERAHVPHEIAPLPAGELGVTTGHGDVIEEDVALRMASGPGDVCVQHKLRAGVGTPLDHEHARALRQLGERDTDLLLGHLSAAFDRQE